MIHFCFGNGNSRKRIDIEQYKKYGTVVGCNAIYRDFTPDILVALDSRMNHEIYRSGYCFNNISYLGYWTPIPSVVAENMLLEQKGKVDVEFNGCQEAVYHGADGVFTYIQGRGKNLGVTYVTGTKEDKVKNIEPDVDKFAYATGARSIYLSCEIGADEVYIIGHDLYSSDNKINNIYAGTDCYAKDNADLARPDNPDETFNWIKQHKNTFDSFKFTKFYKVNPEDESINVRIKEWKDCENLEYITHTDLDKKFKT
ncbi:MAG: hypothetical protein H8D92_00440 [Pelagibacteraceae bacterium]|nr:hypothetical protein [Pelagibacteraceae bacterium]